MLDDSELDRLAFEAAAAAMVASRPRKRSGKAVAPEGQIEAARELARGREDEIARLCGVWGGSDGSTEILALIAAAHPAEQNGGIADMDLAGAAEMVLWRVKMRDEFKAKAEAKPAPAKAPEAKRPRGRSRTADSVSQPDRVAAPPALHGEIVGTVSQDAIATAFVGTADGRLLYCHSEGRWFFWEGHWWHKDERQLAFHFARKVARELSERLGDDDQKAIRRATFAAGVERFARSDPFVARTASDWDRDPWLLGTPGGTVDLKTGVLRPGDPADGITRVTAIPPADKANCPIWRTFLREATAGDGELVRYLAQICGYCLTGVVREHILLFLYGPGGNGKTTFLRVLTDILAAYAMMAPMTTFTAAPYDQHPTDLAMLRGARLVTAIETESGRAWAEARIKQVTGADPITARFMRQDFFTYVPQFKLLTGGNHVPTLRNVDDAIRRRVRIIPFQHKPVTADTALPEKLRGEYPAILRWMIEGCADWLANGLVLPASVASETATYLDTQAAVSEPFAEWLKECCELAPGGTRFEAFAAHLFDSWRAFASNAGIDSGSQKAFAKSLENAGCVSHRGAKGVRKWLGIQLKISLG
ncbi:MULTISPECIES: phage/plasmid primase, P4 family [Rhodomicrobium]|uniref:phage/plasmid primase, P4 family n=1 Tax=Rhodomicrobium TaxID=1068 RepID=UPI000B4BEF74|nr:MULTISPECIES: phage/plasmid primase, P4 family [Rhodomicrobium]